MLFSGAHPVHEARPSTLKHLVEGDGPGFQKALLYAELSRERCAELVLLLGFVIIAASMIIVLVLLFPFVFLRCFKPGHSEPSLRVAFSSCLRSYPC